MSIEKLSMGLWYTISGEFVKRRSTFYNGTGYQRETTVTWTRQPTTAVRAMYIGQRTVYTGLMVQTGYGEDFEEYFKRTEAHRVYLFVLTPYQNPIYVSPDDVDYIRVFSKVES